MPDIMDVRISAEGVSPDEAMERWLAAAAEQGVPVGNDDMTELLGSGVGVVTYDGERYVIDYLPYREAGDSQPQEIRARALLEAEWRVRSVRNRPL